MASSGPSIIRCSNPVCNYDIAVPREAFDWSCESPGCKEAGVRNDSTLTQCHVCENPKIMQRKEAECMIACGACQTVQPVRRSLFSVKVQAAAQGAKKQLAGAKEWAQSVRVPESIRLPAESMACPHCTSIVQLPAKLGEEEKERDLQCPMCTMVFRVPRFWEEAKEIISKNIAGARSHPAQFNCEHCLKLHNSPVDSPVMWCDGCGRETTIPSSNFTNELRRESLIVARSLVKAYYYVRDTPYISCQICHAVVRAGQEGKFACQNCGCEQGTDSFDNQPTANFQVDNHFDGGAAAQPVEVR